MPNVIEVFIAVVFCILFFLGVSGIALFIISQQRDNGTPGIFDNHLSKKEEGNL